MVPLSKSGVPKGTVGSNPTLSARQGGLYGYQECTKSFSTCKGFLREMSGQTFVTPVCAERRDNVWVVQIKVGFAPMQFEIDAETGEILRYCECR